MKVKLFCTIVALFINTTSANTIINGTRVIYPEKNKEIIVQLVNNGDEPSLIQAWIDNGDINSTPETAHVPFLLTPPVVKVSGHNGQQLRIQKLPAPLPGDEESVFYLNVLDIPPKPENMLNENTIQLAIKSRIKLFYRPESMKGTLDDAVSKIVNNTNGNNLTLINNSPFHITVSNIATNKKEFLMNDAIMINPYSQTNIRTKRNISKGETFYLKYVDDLGSYKSKSFVAR
ncbi:molecular chaperone [Klebsiella aerogenes]|nr:molecular chaperone [Klebsiella aerogenes]ELA2606817.1 molecular chaperone [Klebsiella aerogenes]EMC9823459.1 molecular chaperone [Klebsiella aerogenes]HEO1674992.1 molecular chaperone [Klebsiella aerogenes]